jgi:hypothetical protein
MSLDQTAKPGSGDGSPGGDSKGAQPLDFKKIVTENVIKKQC